MPLNLNDLIKKAKDKGITSSHTNNSLGQLIRPWQQESVLFGHTKIQETYWQQTDNTTENKVATNSQQSDYKQVTNKQQAKVIINETDNKETTQPTTLSTTKLQQTNNYSAIKASFSSLVGLQRAIIVFIYNECKIARSKITESLTLEHISMALKASKGCIKTTIQRLEAKGFIERVVFKNGRGGWSKYAIPDLLFQELLQYESNNKLATNRQQIGNNQTTQLATQLTTEGSVDSSNYIKNTTTTLPEAFKQIDCSPLVEIGFDESHIIQIHREYIQKPELSLSAEIIQNSINALAFDLKHNNIANTFKRPTIVVFISLLKQGKPYSSVTPEKCLSPREEAMKEYLLAQEKKNLKTLEVEIKAKELALQEWICNLTDETLLEFNQDNESCPNGMPEKLYQLSRRKKALALAKEYFDAVIWPKERKKVLSEESNVKQM